MNPYEEPYYDGDTCLVCGAELTLTEKNLADHEANSSPEIEGFCSVKCADRYIKDRRDCFC